jgi:hypothetical protein
MRDILGVCGASQRRRHGARPARHRLFVASQAIGDQDAAILVFEAGAIESVLSVWIDTLCAVNQHARRRRGTLGGSEGTRTRSPYVTGQTFCSYCSGGILLGSIDLHVGSRETSLQKFRNSIADLGTPRQQPRGI